MILGRSVGPKELSYCTKELFKQLLRSHLETERGHELNKQRLQRTLTIQGWTFSELFRKVDRDNRGSICGVDIEQMVSECTNGGYTSLARDVDLLTELYNSSSTRRISFFDFQDQLSR